MFHTIRPVCMQLQKILLDAGPLAEGYKKAGQFVQVKIGESKPGFFAIASAPDPNNMGVLELLIKNQGGTAELLCGSSQGEQSREDFFCLFLSSDHAALMALWGYRQHEGQVNKQLD